MRLTDVLSIATSAVFGIIAGFLTFDTVGAVIGGLTGALFSFVATTTFVGGAAGALIGGSVVETICLPDSCTGLEIGGTVVLGIASLIGVGLVAALVTRSFDEYNDSVEAGRPPPEVGCEVSGEDPDASTTS
jgi:hypothetical protein